MRTGVSVTKQAESVTERPDIVTVKRDMCSRARTLPSGESVTVSRLNKYRDTKRDVTVVERDIALEGQRHAQARAKQIDHELRARLLWLGTILGVEILVALATVARSAA